MKKLLTQVTSARYYYKDGERVDGVPEFVRGDLTNIYGNLTGISGNLDDCEITDEDRAKGIDIKDLVED